MLRQVMPIFSPILDIEAAKKAAGEFPRHDAGRRACGSNKPILAIHVTRSDTRIALTCARLEQPRDFPLLRFEPVGSLVDDLREVKDEIELSRVEAAQRIAEQAFDQLLGIITPEMTEREVALELEYRMRKLGSEGVAFDTIAVSGTQSALPHGVPRDVKLERGF